MERDTFTFTIPGLTDVTFSGILIIIVGRNAPFYILLHCVLVFRNVTHMLKRDFLTFLLHFYLILCGFSFQSQTAKSL